MIWIVSEFGRQAAVDEAVEPAAYTISQRMEVVCPGLQSIVERRSCTLRVMQELASERLRQLEVVAALRATDLGVQNIIASWSGLALTFVGLLVLILTLRETRRATAAATTAAEAAVEANRGFFAGAQREQRAYVSVIEARVDLLEYKRPVLHVYYRNVGQTPANRLAVRSAIKFVTPGEAVDYSQLDAPTAPRSLGPTCDGAHVATKGKELLHADVVELTGGRKDFYAWGQIEYEDIFGVRRLTSFRRKLDPPAVGKDILLLLDQSGGNEAT